MNGLIILGSVFILCLIYGFASDYYYNNFSKPKFTLSFLKRKIKETDEEIALLETRKDDSTIEIENLLDYKSILEEELKRTERWDRKHIK